MAVVIQNKFLENIISYTQELESIFLIANVKMSHYPIIYCSQGFSEDTGFSRNEVNSKQASCNFLFGRQTDRQAIKGIDIAIQKRISWQVQIILYGKTGMKHWYNLRLVPIKDDDNNVVLLLLLFNDIGHLKPPIHESPRRKWKKAFRKILKKPDFNEFRKNVISEKEKLAKRKPLGLETLRQRTENIFIPAYGSEKLQLPKFVINQSLSCKITWDVFILMLILYTAILVPFTISFEYNSRYISFFDTFVDIMFIIDICLTFFTTFIDKTGNQVTNLKVIRINYLKGWFLLDAVASFPYSVLVMQLGNGSNVVALIRILKIFRLLRVGKVNQKMGRFLQTSTVKLSMWILLFCLCGHWMACIWYSIALKIDNPAVVEHSWLALLAIQTHSPYGYKVIDGISTVVPGSGPSFASLYISSLYYTMSSLTTCGFGNIAPNTSAEKVFGCITMLVGCVLYAFIFGQVTNIISQLQRNSNTFMDQINAIKRFNSIYKVPVIVSKRLEDYFTSTWAITKGTNEEEILGQCPRDLQSDLCLHIHAKIFKDNPAFGRLTKTSLRCIARYLWATRISPGDTLIYQGENVDIIYFVASGSLEVKHGNDLVGLIGPGDAFGVSIRNSVDGSNQMSVYDVEACSYGSIHCISVNDITEALRIYPTEYIKIKYDLVLAFNITKKIKITTENGDVYETSLPLTMNKVAHEQHTSANSATKHEYGSNVDVLAGMSELKNELRRETERMNSKMSLVEAQMRLVLKSLRRQNKIDVDPEIGSQLNELISLDGDEMDEWFTAYPRKSTKRSHNENSAETESKTGNKVYGTVERLHINS